MDREAGLALVRERVGTKNLVKHMLACEAVMRALARRLGEDEEAWGLAGLVHDVDYDETQNDPARHAEAGAQVLEAAGAPADVVHAVRAHNDKAPRQSAMDKALWCTDPATGFLVACALVRAEKKLAAVDVAFALKRMKEKRFAAGASREAMRASGELGLPLEEFLALALGAMQGVAAELGL